MYLGDLKSNQWHLYHNHQKLQIDHMMNETIKNLEFINYVLDNIQRLDFKGKSHWQYLPKLITNFNF